ncbi:MAG TPA: Rieske 2Fe-2S domain-containing protein [Thermoanaerobaculia bacterium]|nr:Rieske 2Fe-2S domain-containing protein [Thermoanaerobaculia bacterium]
MTDTPPDQLSVPPNGRPYHEQPQWRNDFPIDWPQDELVARRDFTKFLVLTSFAFVVGQAWIVLENLRRRRRGLPPVRKIADLSTIPIGSALTFAYPAAHDDCILVRTGEERFVAYGQKCTHLSCAVTPRPKDNCLYCPCHNGVFDLETGVPTAGPPRRPLPRIQLEIRDGAIYATGVEVRG